MHKMMSFGENTTKGGYKMYNGFVIKDEMIIEFLYDGSEPKFLIEYGGKEYLVKDSSYDESRKEQCYAPFCEYYGSNIIRALGLKCQEAWLGYYDDRAVVILNRLFTETAFKPFQDIHQSSAGTNLELKEYTYDDVLYVMHNLVYLTGSELDKAIKLFWEMWFCDALLGNRDRHGGNWGVEKFEDSHYEFSTIFDNGASLFPNVKLENWRTREFIYDRVFVRPVCQFKKWTEKYNDRAMRTNYFEVMQSLPDEILELGNFIRKADLSCIVNKLYSDIVPPEFHEWVKTICYFRQQCLFNNLDYGSLWNNLTRR